MRWNATEPLTRWEKVLLAGFFLLLVALGGLVEYRSAFLTRRMGDLDCFLRAAWAVRTGNDPYAVTSDNDWHYNYPPLYAILMTPLADPPRGEDPAGFLPYAWSVAICYLINVICLFVAAHVLACAIEAKSPDASFRTQPTFCRRWWVLRLWPVLICFLPIGHTMMRGQVNVIVLAMLCAAYAGWLQGQNFRAGMWLAFAICIKVIPAYLIVYPLWKRDWRGLLGCASGLLIGLAIVPMLTFGPARTQTHYETYGKVFFAPFFKLNDDDTRKEEILGVNATDSVGVKNALHNWIYPDAGTRPEEMHVGAKAAYLLLGFAMTFATLFLPSPRRGRGAGGEGGNAPENDAHQFGALLVLMTIFSPVSHSHYLMFCLPIVMILLARQWHNQESIFISKGLVATFAVFFVTMAVAYLPGMEILKDRCAALFATLPLWAIPIVQAWRDRPAAPANDETRTAPRRAA
jgi:hypothetical protein